MMFTKTCLIPFDKKQSNAIGRKSEGGIETFFNAKICDFFHSVGKIPFESEALNNLIR